MIILGISGFYHDSAACLIKDGDVLSASHEERFTRVRHDSSFPINSITFCLKSNNLKPSMVDYVVFYDKPFLKFERLLETYIAFAPRGFKSFFKSMPLWLRDKLFQKKNLINNLNLIDNKIDWNKKLLFSEHHLSHASSAFYPSPFKESAILTMDGVGEWTTTSTAIGKDNKIEFLQEINFPHSLGLLYSAFTYFLGFKVNSGEYKMMGLAPYGKPAYVQLIKDNLINIREDGSFKLNMEFFNYPTGLTMTNSKFNNLFNSNPRKSYEDITAKHMNIAASIQEVLNDIVLKICKNIKNITGQKNLCIAGGVALNCVTNGLIYKSNIFEKIWIQPASGDAGGALGAALASYYMGLNNNRIINPEDSMKGSYLGASYNDDYIESILIKEKMNYEKFSEDKIVLLTAKLISEGMAIGWFNGSTEFGPRALGNRSIIADPRSPLMQKKLNLKVKFRESFRPFAPTILLDDVSEWFELNDSSPYMLLVSNLRSDKRKDNIDDIEGLKKIDQIRSFVPAITHVDFSARIQTVCKKNNFKFYKLLKEFKKLTGCPMIINTSFNIRGEPIVNSPQDALRCFMQTNIDVLVIGNYLLFKKSQGSKVYSDYKTKYLND